ncbi:MAG TPA: sugar transferase, partial [Pirellulaceae bacterium]|nr:sugar transferase [Pirellulaceae bacterium]
ATLFVYPMQWHGDADGATAHGVAAENSTDEAANDDSSNDEPHDDDLDSPQGRDGVDCNSSAVRSRVSCKREPAELLFVRPFPAWKRAIDVVGALVGLVLLSPVMAVAALAIKLTSPGPILFRQLRAGLGGQPFTIFKFRTMRVDAEALKPALRAHSEQDGPAFKLNDPRVTRLGKWLRSSCVDELPQLWNVLIGDMSLVGPRPLPCDESAACVRWQQHRLRVRPGLTCIWQTHRDNSIPFDDWMRMDIRYMRETSLWQDLKLVVQTIASILVPALRPRLGSTQTGVTRHGLPRSTN